MVDTTGEGVCQPEEGVLQGLVSLWNPEAADRKRQAKQTVALSVSEAKTHVGGVRRSHGEKLDWL